MADDWEIITQEPMGDDWEVVDQSAEPSAETPTTTAPSLASIGLPDPMLSPGDVGPRGSQARPQGLREVPTMAARPTTADLQAGAQTAQDALNTSRPGARGAAFDMQADQAARAEKGRLIDDAIRKASITARGGRGFNERISAEFQRLAFDPKAMEKFSPAERSAIDAVAKGGLLRDSLSILANSTSQSGILGRLAGSMVTGPAKWLGGKAAGAAANRVGEMVRAGPQGMDAARTQQKYANDIKALNEKISAVIKDNGGEVPKAQSKRYAEYKQLAGERSMLMREYLARVAKNPGAVMAGARAIEE